VSFRSVMPRSAVVALALLTPFLLDGPVGAASHDYAALPVLYVSDAQTGAIGVFRIDNGRKVASIAYPMAPGGLKSGGGAGLAVDSAGNLYAAYGFQNGFNYPGKTVIFAYAPGQTHWFTAIDGGCCAAPNLAISKRGEIAEAQEYFPPWGGGDFAFIEPGKKYVGGRNYALAGGAYDRYDSKGNLWVDGVDATFHPHFGVFPRGTTTYQEVVLDPAPRLGPLTMDLQDNVLVASGAILYAFDHHGRRIFGVTLALAAGVVSIALSSDGKTLYAGEIGGKVLAYRYPSGGAPIATYEVGGTPFAIALGRN
jgi:hypothetical protein